LAVTTFQQRNCRHENPPPLCCSRHAVRLRRLRFPPGVIVDAVHWYLRFSLSHRDVEELPAERGVEVDHVTIHRWVQGFTPPDRFGQRLTSPGT